MEFIDGCTLEALLDLVLQSIDPFHFLLNFVLCFMQTIQVGFKEPLVKSSHHQCSQLCLTKHRSSMRKDGLCNSRSHKGTGETKYDCYCYVSVLKRRNQRCLCITCNEFIAISSLAMFWYGRLYRQCRRCCFERQG